MINFSYNGFHEETQFSSVADKHLFSIFSHNFMGWRYTTNATKLMGSYNLVNPFWTKFHLWRNRSHDKMKLPRRCCIFSKILGYGSVTLLKIRHLQGCSSCIFPVKYSSMVCLHRKYWFNMDLHISCLCLFWPYNFAPTAMVMTLTLINIRFNEIQEFYCQLCWTWTSHS